MTAYHKCYYFLQLLAIVASQKVAKPRILSSLSTSTTSNTTSTATITTSTAQQQRQCIPTQQVSENPYNLKEIYEKRQVPTTIMSMQNIEDTLSKDFDNLSIHLKFDLNLVILIPNNFVL